MREKYNIWKTQKTMEEKIKNILIIFVSLYIWFYVLLFIIVLYKIKKILNLIFTNF